MKTLTKVDAETWLDLSLLTGVTKVKGGFHLNVGENGVRFPRVMTKKEIKVLLKLAGVRGF